MKYVTCPDCKGEKTITEVQKVKIVSMDVVGYNADGTPNFEPDGTGDVLELPCKQCRGKGEVPDISYEDQRRAINIVDTWAVKAMSGMGEVPDTDDLIEAVAVALVEERERSQKVCPYCDMDDEPLENNGLCPTCNLELSARER